MLLLPGCFGVLDDAEQPVTVFTDPPGAHCELRRNGRWVGTVSPSPGLLRVNNRKSDISVYCSKALHEAATAVLVSSRRDLTIGDIVVRGPIGLAFEAGTGAAREYPSSITLYLPPLSFASARERDRYYNRVKAHASEQAADEIARIGRKCGETLTRRCRNRMSAIAASRDDSIADLETKRQRAKIGAG
ncbi:MAG: hypothetical protein F4Y03_13710 [Alphaproteobacteria bacterium]|nr:hypothetical protein [Alphaproteobacteria bacterium]